MFIQILVNWAAVALQACTQALKTEIITCQREEDLIHMLLLNIIVGFLLLYFQKKAGKKALLLNILMKYDLIVILLIQARQLAGKKSIRQMIF